MILGVVRASWAMLARDRAALALSFVVPVVFFSIFAAIFAGRGGGEATPKVRVLVVDEDDTEASRRLLTALGRESALVLRRAPRAPAGGGEPAPYDRAGAEAAVRAGEAPVALVVPAGFGAARISFGPAGASARPRIELLADRSDPVAPQLLQGLLQKVAMTGLSDLVFAGAVEQLDALVGFDAGQRERVGALIEGARRARTTAPGATVPGVGGTDGADGSGDDAAAMPIAVEVRDLLGETKRNPMVAFYAAGLGVMFLLFSAAGAGGALIEERESGTLDRLLATRLTMTQLLAGKLGYLTTLGLVQLAVMFGWGWAVFGLELRGHLLGFAAIALPTALACSAFGLVLAAISRTRKQLVAVSNLVILSISALGGSMFPRFLMPESLRQLSLVTFNSWALEGFLDVFWRDLPLSALVPEIGVLLAWTVGLFLIARRVARKWEIV